MTIAASSSSPSRWLSDGPRSPAGAVRPAAGLGDITTGLAAPLVARKVARGTSRRAALWLNAFGLTDLIVALTLGALTGYQLIDVAPSAAAITELPLALVPTAAVPLLIALHITSLRTLAKIPHPALGDAVPGMAPVRPA